VIDGVSRLWLGFYMGWDGSAILSFSYGRAPGGLDIAVFTRRPDPILQSANHYHYP
jgi:hypothetical protein